MESPKWPGMPPPNSRDTLLLADGVYTKKQSGRLWHVLRPSVLLTTASGCPCATKPGKSIHSASQLHVQPPEPAAVRALTAYCVLRTESAQLFDCVNPGDSMITCEK